ncbi:MAG: hypothetical protein ACRESI_03195 [Gammaproteobacteria bacterium]
MIATPHFVFVHLHKVGGQFVNRLLLAHVPGAHRIGYHLPRSETPEELRQLPVLGFIRNPWDWYVSWYAFNSITPERNPIFRIVSAHGTLGFERTIENLVRLGDSDHDAMRMVISSQLPATRESNLGSGITRDIMALLHEPDRGYVTWIWRYMYLLDGSFDGITTGKYESLRQDLISRLSQLGIPVSLPMQHAIMTTAVVNSSKHGNYKDYYSSALKQLIARKDHEYIASCEYTF